MQANLRNPPGVPEPHPALQLAVHSVPAGTFRHGSPSTVVSQGVLTREFSTPGAMETHCAAAGVTKTVTRSSTAASAAVLKDFKAIGND
jgi:hypothetical protein